MSLIGTVEADALGAVSGNLWKFVAIAVLIAGLAATGYAGAQWWLAARDRDKALAELATEKSANDDLRVGIREQNRAVTALATAKTAADARGAAAQQTAAVRGKILAAALARQFGIKAQTCTDAMPAVRQIIKDIK